MPGEPDEIQALRAAAAGPLAYCRRLRAEIWRNHLLAGHDPDSRAPRLVRLVSYIEKHLFEESLGPRAACRAVGIADTNIATELRAYTRYTVAELIARLRIGAAIHLVVHTQLKVSGISELLGFETYKTFLRAYKYWAGATPEATRRYEGDPSTSFDFADLALLMRVGTGELTSEELDGLEAALAERFPDEFAVAEEAPPATGAAPAEGDLDAEAFERFQATERWPELAERTFPQQRELVRAWCYWTPAPFELLHRKSRQAGRRDSRRGVEVARLALDSLDGNEERLGPRIHELRVEGWSWLADAQRLDLDFGAAEASFRRAEGVLDAHDLRAARVAGVFYSLKGTLRIYERRHDEAVELFDQALAPFESAGDVHDQVRALLRRIAALSYAHRFDETESTLRKAKELLRAAPDEALSFQIDYATLSTLVQAGRLDRAEAYYQEIVEEIDGLRLCDDTLAALEMLREAMTGAEVTTGVLRELRSQLTRDPLAM